jgi:protein-L-isoaspartate(D-aspartate) O-methyltransferase
MKYLIGIVINCILIIHPAAENFFLQRQQMVDQQIKQRGITNERILNAFLKVKRHRFVRPEFQDKAYLDQRLVIDLDQVISESYIVAIMTYVIAPEYNKKVLEIGTGSGYHAAILAELVKDVYTVEIYESMSKKAQKRLDNMGYRNIHFKVGNGFKGWEEYAPFDGIIVTCSHDQIPQPLIDQLAVGGKMIIPVDYSSQIQELILIEKLSNGSLKEINLIPVGFVPLIRGTNEQ